MFFPAVFRKPNKSLIIMGLAVLFFGGFFGLSQMDMSSGVNSAMPGCPLMPAGTICQMTPFQHISSWQNAFAATAPQNNLFLSLGLLLFSAAAAIFTRLKFPPGDFHKKVRFPPEESFSAKNHFSELFSNGILNPKIF